MIAGIYRAPALLLTLTAFMWGLNAIFGQLAVGEITPFALVLARWVMVAAAMWALCGSEVIRCWPAIRRRLGPVVFMAAAGFTGFNTIFYIASAHTTAVNVGIIQGAMPVMVLVGAFLAYGDRVTAMQVAGVVVTLVGVAVVAGRGELSVLLGLEFNHGDLLMLVAAVLYSLYAVALRARPDVPGQVLFTVFAVVAAVTAVPMAAWEAAQPGYVWPSAEGWAIALAVAVFPSCLAQLFFMRGVDLIGPGRAGVFINLVPVFASGLAVAWLGEDFALYHAVALTLVLGGIALSQGRRRGAGVAAQPEPRLTSPAPAGGGRGRTSDMIDIDGFERDYDTARRNFRLEIPEHFNFAFDVLDERARRADKTAVIAVGPDGHSIRRVSYAELAEGSARFANALRRLGLRKGDAACIVIGRIPEWHTVLFGCMKAGVISMPGTNLLTAKDIAYRINQSGAKAAIVTPEHVGKVDEVRAQCPTLEHCIVVGEAPSGWVGFFDACAAERPEIGPEAAGPFRSDETMMIYFTSGTTALPKMVPRDYGYALAHLATGLFWMDLRESDVHWTLTDTGWAKAAWGMLFPQLLSGVTMVMFDAKGFDVERHLQLIAELGVTTFCAPPTVYRLFAQQDLSQYDLSSLRRCLGAGEPLNPEVIRYWKRHTGTTIADGYGQTETINIVANFPGTETRYGSMGRPVPGYDVDVVDDEGRRVAPGHIGHIAVRTDGPRWPAGLFHGYLRDGTLDTSSFRHGWYYTGDTATKDEAGYLWFVGRADDLISSAGYRISPFEVESALLEHPAVAESAVIGVPDETRGQIVKAYVILAKGHEPTAATAYDIQEFCKRQTAPYKYPREIEFVTELPKTISGKIRRVELRQSAGAQG